MSKCLGFTGHLNIKRGVLHYNRNCNPPLLLPNAEPVYRIMANAFHRLITHFQDLQMRPQVQRLQVLELLNVLMSRHRDALKELGNESLIGITDLVSGEKDPRNLMIIFSILNVVMVEWDISKHAEVGCVSCTCSQV